MARKQRRGDSSVDVTQGIIWRQLLTLCVPIFFSSFFQQAYTLIGTYIVGQFGGKLALGGIQATMVLTELCIGFCVAWAPVARSLPVNILASTTTSA
ncbi:hypothetical protein [Megamonas sp.]|uniref:hypothetical protein n=1 Tax=Megamonas sp. TaxID=2049033 RepID=UPI00258281D2|nr:hypothetical protein [Megamonas sp.]